MDSDFSHILQIFFTSEKTAATQWWVRFYFLSYVMQCVYYAWSWQCRNRHKVKVFRHFLRKLQKHISAPKCKLSHVSKRVGLSPRCSALLIHLTWKLYHCQKTFCLLSLDSETEFLKDIYIIIPKNKLLFFSYGHTDKLISWTEVVSDEEYQTRF